MSAEVALTRDYAEPPPLSVRLRQAIDAHPEELSIRQLGKRVNVSHTYIKSILDGDADNLTTKVAAALERVLNQPPGYFYRRWPAETAAAHADSVLIAELRATGVLELALRLQQLDPDARRMVDANVTALLSMQAKNPR